MSADGAATRRASPTGSAERSKTPRDFSARLHLQGVAVRIEARREHDAEASMPWAASCAGAAAVPSSPALSRSKERNTRCTFAAIRASSSSSGSAFAL